MVRVVVVAGSPSSASRSATRWTLCRARPERARDNRATVAGAFSTAASTCQRALVCPAGRARVVAGGGQQAAARRRIRKARALNASPAGERGGGRTLRLTASVDRHDDSILSLCTGRQGRHERRPEMETTEAPRPARRPHAGGCHCGAVRFEVAARGARRREPLQLQRLHEDRGRRPHIVKPAASRCAPARTASALRMGREDLRRASSAGHCGVHCSAAAPRGGRRRLRLGQPQLHRRRRSEPARR